MINTALGRNYCMTDGLQVCQQLADANFAVGIMTSRVHEGAAVVVMAE